MGSKDSYPRQRRTTLEMMEEQANAMVVDASLPEVPMHDVDLSNLDLLDGVAPPVQSTAGASPGSVPVGGYETAASSD